MMCFFVQLPAVICPGVTLVICPLVSLIQDQIMHLSQVLFLYPVVTHLYFWFREFLIYFSAILCHCR